MTPATRLLELTALTGLNTPAAHFLSITQTGGAGDVYVYNELEVSLVADYVVELDSAVYTVVVEPEFTVVLEQDYEVVLD